MAAPDKPGFVLIHGSFHGPWCWSRIVPLLEAAGHVVATPDLAASQARGLDDYATEVTKAVDAIAGRVILVGHSMGGIVASQVSEWRPDRIIRAVYVCGLLLTDGQSLFDFVEAEAHRGVEDLVLKSMRVSADGEVATFPAAAAPDVFYNECAAGDAAWAAAQLRPQPLAIYRSRLALSAERYGRVPRVYVEATLDRAVSPVYQRVMTEHTACAEIFTLASDHSPFLSKPPELAALLLQEV